MRFQLPQFIETEINIIGPFTLKQFLWIAAGTIFLFLDFTLLKGLLAIVIGIIIAAIAGALAFLKIDDMPLINYIANMLSFSFGSKKYIYTNETSQNDILIPGNKNG
jgi:membrane protein implicated in regulation of membrane protease activity